VVQNLDIKVLAMSLEFLKNSFTKKMAAQFYILKKAVPRSVLAMRYLKGEGIEIGALHNPVFLGPFARAKYVDRMSVKDLVLEYQELRGLDLVEPDIVDNGEVLSKVSPNSVDFIIANHFIEHCEDPIRTIKNFSIKLKNNGILYLAVPDKRFTFDKERESTPYEHLVLDHESGPEISRRNHYLDWANCFHEKASVETIANSLMEREHSIHFHVWMKIEFANFLIKMIDSYKLPLKVIDSISVGDEGIFIVRKIESN